MRQGPVESHVAAADPQARTDGVAHIDAAGAAGAEISILATDPEGVEVSIRSAAGRYHHAAVDAADSFSAIDLLVENATIQTRRTQRERTETDLIRMGIQTHAVPDAMNIRAVAQAD